MYRLSITIALLLLVAVVIPRARAEETVIDMQKLAQELQRIEQTGLKFKMIWWTPTEFWQESFRNSPMTPEQRKAFLTAVEDYIVISVTDGELSPLGTITSRTLEQIRDDLSITVEGKALQPLTDDELPEETQAVLASMKPTFASLLGNYGKAMEWLVFKGTDKQGNRLLDPREKKQFTISYRGKDYQWRLPLGSLLPTKYDQETGEAFPGNYDFNPYTGAKLTTEAPSAAGKQSNK